ncbi:alkaline phosphatase family protein [Solirubrobacter soli]|uniref:alkaline phosphatase family protein n=1 Tax=Solirubrobacter soli TaxID=363832 RepID=UPI0007E8CF1C|nr:alkaline phosphatase family protein [Solirubrobacter soli]
MLRSAVVRRSMLGGAVVLVAAACVFAVADADTAAGPPARTPIDHIVVIFGENQSFDHYFGTYPNAANNVPGDPLFTAQAGTPAVNGLTPALLTSNPNMFNPRRLKRSESVTCDHNHNYAAEQLAFNGGLMNQFVENTGSSCNGDRGMVMNYYDGNSVTALWNYAQHYAISDAHFGSTFGPSTIGALNTIAGTTHGVSPAGLGVQGTMVLNSPPSTDDCSGSGATMSGQNIGDLMNTAGMTWGWFAGGFRPIPASCSTKHKNAVGADVQDYLPHHMPFQFYASTANPHHLPPLSVANIGQTDQANHQYDLTDFDAALAAGNLPQVSFLKAIASEDGHPGYSGPLDEQRFIVRTVNAIQSSPEWNSTAIFLAYDDSDGWYDHVMPTIRQGSDTPSDGLNGPNTCGPAPQPGDYRGRCGPGPRLPLVLISPYARQNFVDHTVTEQASIIRFIEYNWSLPRLGDQSFDDRAGELNGMFDFLSGAVAPKLLLDTATGNPPGAPVVTATPTPVVPTPTPTATPTPTPKPKLAVSLSCKVTGGGKKVTISCKASGKDAGKRTAVRFRIVKGSKVLATKSVNLSKKQAKVVIRPKTKLKKGKYTLRITITQTGGTLALTKTIRLK